MKGQSVIYYALAMLIGVSGLMIVTGGGIEVADSAIPPTPAVKTITVDTSSWFGNVTDIEMTTSTGQIYLVTDGSVWFNVTTTAPQPVFYVKYVKKISMILNKTQSVAIIALVAIVAVSGITFASLANPAVAVVEAVAPIAPVSSEFGTEGVGVSGWVKITVIDENGNIKSVHEDHNLIVTVGLGATSDHLFGTSHVTGEGVFDYIGLGTSSTAVSAGHTDCQTPTGSRLQDASVTNSGSNGAVINQSWVAVLGSITVEEICLFDAVSSGNMYARQVTGSIVVGATDTVNAEWTVSFADSDAS